MSATVARRYDEVAADYDDAHVGGRWEIYDAATFGLARTFLPPEGRVLDAGAGSGKFASWFLQQGYEVTLLDPSARMLERARSKLAAYSDRASYQVGVVERLELPDASFDFVFCEGDPLSYARDERERAARELVRVLRPGGGLYVSCDNRGVAALARLLQGDAAAALDAWENGTATDPYGLPVHAFRAEELRALLEDAGARDVRVLGKIGLAHLAPASVHADAASFSKLKALEAAIAFEPAFAGLATHLHATGRKP